MNETAKKLREVADRMGDGVVNSAPAIIMARKMFDVRSTTTFGGDLGNVLTVIADELDELQARATEANNLRKKLESAEDKAERRKQHIGYLETALHDKNALLEQRGGTIARLTAECGELRKQVPSERERQILNMWPRFEDGECVWLGNKYEDNEGNECFASGVHLDIDGPILVDSEGFHDLYRKGKRVKRPVPKVLDADGVEIKVGDTVWHEDGSEQLVEEMNRYGVRCFDGDKRRTFNPKYLTNTRPDSWERLEEDASKEPCSYFGYEDKLCGDGAGCPANKLGNCSKLKAADLVRRAKALAGAEAGR